MFAIKRASDQMYFTGKKDDGTSWCADIGRARLYRKKTHVAIALTHLAHRYVYGLSRGRWDALAYVYRTDKTEGKVHYEKAIDDWDRKLRGFCRSDFAEVTDFHKALRARRKEQADLWKEGMDVATVGLHEE